MDKALCVAASLFPWASGAFAVDGTLFRTLPCGGHVEKSLARTGLQSGTKPLRNALAVSAALAANTSAALEATQGSVRVASVTDGPKIPGALDGMYVAGSVGRDADGVYDTGVRRQFLQFFPDGRVLRGYPCRGVDGYDLNDASPESAGRYSISGNRIDFVWRSGDKATATKGPNGQIPLYGYVFLPTMKSDGLKLDGVYARISGGSGAAISFRADGTFTDQGFLADTALTDSERSWRSGDSPRGAGTYRTGRNTIHLEYASGTYERIGFHVLDGAARRLDICGHGFERKGPPAR